MLPFDEMRPALSDKGWLNDKYVEIKYMGKTYVGVVEKCCTYDYGGQANPGLDVYAHGFSMYIVEDEKLKKICLEIPANKFKITFLPKNDETIFRLKYDL